MSYPASLAYLLISKEAIWGTLVTAEKDCGLIVTDVTPSIEREIMQSQGISSIETQKITTGLVKSNLTLEGDFQHGRMFDFLIGEATHAETTGDWVHTFTVDNNPISMTGEKGNNGSADTQWIIDGLLAESGELSIELNGNLRLSCDMKGRASENGTTGKTAVLSTLPVFPHSLCTVTVNSIAATECQKASITIAKVTEGAGGVSSNVEQQKHAVELKFDFSGEFGFTTTALHQLAMGGVTLKTDGDPTPFDFEITADNGVALGSGQRKVHFAIENCQSAGFEEPTSVGGLTFVTISGNGTFKELYTVDNISDVNWD